MLGLFGGFMCLRHLLLSLSLAAAAASEEKAAAGEKKAATKRPSSLAPVVGYRDIYSQLHLNDDGIPKVLMLLGGDSDTGSGEAPSWYSSAAMRFKQGRTKTAAFFAVAAGRDAARAAARFGIEEVPPGGAIFVCASGKARRFHFSPEAGAGERSRALRSTVEAAVSGEAEEQAQPRCCTHTDRTVHSD